MELLNPKEKKIFTTTDLTPAEIFGIPTLLRYADIFDSDLMRKWVEEFLLMRISRLRLGRKEIMMLMTGLRESMEIAKGKAKIGDMYQGLR